MVWRGEIENHYENVSKAFTVLGLIENDEFEVKNGIRAVILEELKKSCECIIEWIDDENNRYSRIASDSIVSLELGYDIEDIIEIRTFIYQLLAKPLSKLLN